MYVLYRPDGTPCYVGKGKGNRVENSSRKSHNPTVLRILKNSGLRSLPHRKILENLTEKLAFELECFLIQEIGRFTVDGPLVNLTDGGDGVCGHSRTPEQRAAMSVARKGRTIPMEQRLRQSLTLKGRVFTVEHRAAISLAKRGKPAGPMSAEQREAIGMANRGQKRKGPALEAIRRAAREMSDEARCLKGQRISQALTGKRLSAVHRAAISRVQKGRRRSAEFRAKVSAGLLATRGHPERNAQIAKLTNSGLTAKEIGPQVGLTEAGVWSARRQIRLAEAQAKLRNTHRAEARL